MIVKRRCWNCVAEMCIGGRIGANIDLECTGDESLWARLWGESLGRIIIAVSPENEGKFLETMTGNTTTYLGEVIESQLLTILDGYEEVISTDVQQMVDSWQGTLDMTGGEI